MQYYKNWEEVPEQWQTQIRPYMFPPKPEDADKYHLEKRFVVVYYPVDNIDDL